MGAQVDSMLLMSKLGDNTSAPWKVADPMSLLARMESENSINALDPMLELGAYEYLWLQDKASFKNIAEKFRAASHAGGLNALPSDLVRPSLAYETLHKVRKLLTQRGVENFGVRVHGAGDYPAELRDATHPIELLYFQGYWELVNTPCVSIVGTRQVSSEGISRTIRLTRALVERGFTIVSGLAKGVDAVAHRTAIEARGETISVVGTPLGVVYPKENAELSKIISSKYLLITQVPVLYYEGLPFNMKRFLFPERNKTMSALSQATIIVEASNTSGTLTQAKAALEQGRKLMILDSCFRNPELTWPKRFEERGAIRIRDLDDVFEHLGTPNKNYG